MFPCGLDPVGVVFMTENEDATEDFDFVNLLIGQLPVRILPPIDVTAKIFIIDILNGPFGLFFFVLIGKRLSTQ